MAKNTVYRVEFENTTKREKERRKAIADAEREAARPRIGGVSRLRQAAMAEADEALRLSTGFGRKGWLAVPREKWDKLDQLEKERLAEATQHAMEAGMAFAVPGTMIAGTRGIRNLEAAFRSGKWAPPAGYPAPNLDLADKMLHNLGGKWSALTRDQKLAIRTRTGLQMRNGGGGAWEYMPAGNIGPGTLTAKSGAYGDVFDFSAVPEYEIAFPGITRTPVKFEKLEKPGVLGYRDANGVALSGEYAGPMRSFERTKVGVHEFLHEVQHRAKQPPGANSATYATVPALYTQRELVHLIKTPAWKDVIGAIAHPLDHIRASRIRGAVKRNLDEGLRVGESAGPLTRDAYQNAGGEIGSRLGAFVNELGMSPKQKAEFLLDDFSELHRRPLDYRLPEDYKAGLDNGVIPTRQDAKGGDTPRNVRAAEGGGDASSETAVSETPVSEAPQNPGGPRIVVNPQVFRDKRDALCVAFNEAFRLVMEENGFEPVSEPTGAQRKFFSDTAYARDELQLRRTILARIATLDTSVKDPTDEQLEETAEMLEMVMEVGAPQNEWEQSAVQRLHDVVVKMRESPRSPAPEERPEETGSARAAEGAGVAMTGAELDFLRRRYESGASMNARQRALVEAADAQGVNRGEIKTVEFSLTPPGDDPAQPAQPVQRPTVEATTTGGGTVDWNGKPTSGAGIYVPNEGELAFLRRRRDSGASLSLQQRRILELTDGNYST